MFYPLSILSLILLALIHLTHGHQHQHQHQHSLSGDGVSFEIRAHWMRKANSALAELYTPCPFAAFGSVIVKHSDLSDGPYGKLVCYSVNQNAQKGNPTLHGEISAINNCSAILTDPEGEYEMSPSEALEEFKKLSLYTNAEPCPMCASAIRWSGFAECIFGTSIEALVEKGWSQISISSNEVFKESDKLPGMTRLVGGVLRNETDPYFSWQYDESFPCPAGCVRIGDGEICEKVEKNDGVDREL